MLLDQYESAFVTQTKGILGEYYESDLVGDKLMTCTKNQIKKEKYVLQYPSFESCLKRKVLKLAIPEEYKMDRSRFLPSERDVITIEIIKKDLISQAMHKGYKHLAAKHDIEKKPRDAELLFGSICVILAKTNLNHKFK